MRDIMRFFTVKTCFSLRMFLVTVLLGTSICISAQEVSKEKTFSDGTRVTSTTDVRFAKAGGWLSASRRLGMSHITFAEDGSSTYAIIMPLNSNHRLNIPIGTCMTLFLENNETIVMPNVKVIERGDNHAEFDRTFTVRPEYAINTEQLEVLNEMEVIKIRIETDTEFIDIQKEDYPREWMFNRMVQRCHDVLVRKQAEKEY